ncbi:unnamed protein product [Urochloa humidicola]
MERLQRVFGASGMGHLPSDSRFPRSPRDANHGGPACPWRSCASCSASLSTTTPSRISAPPMPSFTAAARTSYSPRGVISARSSRASRIWVSGAYADRG